MNCDLIFYIFLAKSKLQKFSFHASSIKVSPIKTTKNILGTFTHPSPFLASRSFEFMGGWID